MESRHHFSSLLLHIFYGTYLVLGSYKHVRYNDKLINQPVKMASVELDINAYAARKWRTVSDMGLEERVNRKVRYAAEEGKETVAVETPEESNDEVERVEEELEERGFETHVATNLDGEIESLRIGWRN